MCPNEKTGCDARARERVHPSQRLDRMGASVRGGSFVGRQLLAAERLIERSEQVVVGRVVVGVCCTTIRLCELEMMKKKMMNCVCSLTSHGGWLNVYVCWSPC